MGLCSKRFGYESPAVGAWTFALSLELVVGLILVLVGYVGQEAKTLMDQQQLYTQRYAVLEYIGVGHLIVAIGVAAIVALGLFVSSCFLLPLCIISMVQSLFLVVTAVICGVMVHPFSTVMKSARFGEDVGTIEASHAFLAVFFGGYILAAGCLSLGALAAFGRAGRMKNDTPIPEAQLYVPCATLLVVSATLAGIGGAGEGSTPYISTILFAVAVALAIIVNLANCCCTPKIFNVAVGAAFAVVAVMSLIFCGMSAKMYSHVVSEYGVLPFDSTHGGLPPKPYPTEWRVFMMMGEGRWLLALACTCLGTAGLGVFAALYALRSVLFCCGKGDTS